MRKAIVLLACGLVAVAGGSATADAKKKKPKKPPTYSYEANVSQIDYTKRVCAHPDGNLTETDLREHKFSLSGYGTEAKGWHERRPGTLRITITKIWPDGEVDESDETFPVDGSFENDSPFDKLSGGLSVWLAIPGMSSKTVPAPKKKGQSVTVSLDDEIPAYQEETAQCTIESRTNTTGTLTVWRIK